MNDDTLKKLINLLQDNISQLAQKQGFNDYRFWDYLGYHEQEPREGENCTGVLTCDGNMLAALFSEYTKFTDDFDFIIEQAGFYYERFDNGIIHFYANDDKLSEQFRELLEWQWITYLIQPEYTCLYNELYAFFEKNPDKFYSLSPRQLEFYVGEIFRNQGYEIEMGPGINDGGVDLKIYQKQDIDQITTLVQVKRYKQQNPIRLEAVSALYGQMEAKGAQQGLFVTTSRYLPGVKKFTDRLSKKLVLFDANDLIKLSGQIKTSIVKDKSRLIADSYLIQLIDDVNAGKKTNHILKHDNSSTIIYSEFALLLKETKFAALIMLLPKYQIRDDEMPGHRRGYEMPVLNHSILQNKTNEYLFRVIVTEYPDGTKAYRGRDRYFTVWDGQPSYYDLND
jgi:hypothetical protein